MLPLRMPIQIALQVRGVAATWDRTVQGDLFPAVSKMIGESGPVLVDEEDCVGVVAVFLHLFGSPFVLALPTRSLPLRVLNNLIY